MTNSPDSFDGSNEENDPETTDAWDHKSPIGAYAEILNDYAFRTFFLNPKSKFYYQHEDRYRVYTEDFLRKLLSGEGLFLKVFQLPENAKKDKKSVRAKTWADFLHLVMTKNWIDWAGELAGIPTGLFSTNDVRCLVTSGPIYPEPKEGDCSWIIKFMQQLFPGDQFHRMEALMRRMYLQKNDPNSPFICPIPIMVGDIDCGKSLFKSEIFIPLLGGRHADAISFITGATFNGEMARADVCVIDDQGFDTRFDQDVATDRMKKWSADLNHRIEAKGKDAINVPIKSALLIILNLMSKNLRLLPEITRDIEDKVIGFLCGKADLPTGEGHEMVIQKIIREQLPAYLYRLLYQLETPPGIISPGRFGLVPFFHPELRAARDEESYATAIMELITVYACENNLPEWKANSTEIFTALAGTYASTKIATLSMCKTPMALGYQLTKACRSHPTRITKDRRRIYTVLTPDADDASILPKNRLKMS